MLSSASTRRRSSCKLMGRMRTWCSPGLREVWCIRLCREGVTWSVLRTMRLDRNTELRFLRRCKVGRPRRSELEIGNTPRRDTSGLIVALGIRTSVCQTSWWVCSIIVPQPGLPFSSRHPTREYECVLPVRRRMWRKRHTDRGSYCSGPCCRITGAEPVNCSRRSLTRVPKPLSTGGVVSTRARVLRPAIAPFM